MEGKNFVLVCVKKGLYEIYQKFKDHVCKMRLVLIGHICIEVWPDKIVCIYFSLSEKIDVTEQDVIDCICKHFHCKNFQYGGPMEGAIPGTGYICNDSSAHQSEYLCRCQNRHLSPHPDPYAYWLNGIY